jgi:hypothetical protein
MASPKVVFYGDAHDKELAKAATKHHSPPLRLEEALTTCIGKGQTPDVHKAGAGADTTGGAAGCGDVIGLE